MDGGGDQKTTALDFRQLTLPSRLPAPILSSLPPANAAKSGRLFRPVISSHALEKTPHLVVVVHEFQGEALLAVPEDQPQIEAGPHLIPSVLQLANAGTRRHVRRAKECLRGGNGLADLRPGGGTPPTDFRWQPLVDAHGFHASDFESNLPLACT